MSDPRSLKAARCVADFLQREHKLELDDFDIQRVASCIDAVTGIRKLEVKIMNARADLDAMVKDLSGALEDEEEADEHATAS